MRLHSYLTTTLILGITLVFLCQKVTYADSTSLPRRPFLGIKLTEDDKQKVVITQIIPGSSAANSELQIGDVVLKIHDTPITSTAQFLETTKMLSSGSRVPCQVLRKDHTLTIEVLLKEWPRETSRDFDILYDVVETGGATLRSILTKPKAIKEGTKIPAVFYIQGIGSQSIESPFRNPDHMRAFIYGLTRRGFAVMRCEKSGVGDSTGKPCSELGLHEEVTDFVEALRKLKSYDFVDAENIFLFGHSAGGWVAPLVASKEPVTGIVVYGTVVRPFSEYLAENHRRNERLRHNIDPVKMEEKMRQFHRFYHLFLTENQALEKILQTHPDLVEVAERVYNKETDLLYKVRNLQYFREINDQNMAKVWANLGIPVYALVGEYETRTMAFDHQYIADIVNFHHPGKGSWKQLPKMDHGFALHSSLQNSAQNEFRGPFGEQIILESAQWMHAVISQNK